MLVPVIYRQRDVLGVDRFNRRVGIASGYDLAPAQAIRRFAELFVNSDESVDDEGFSAVPRKPGYVTADVIIQAFAGFRLADGELEGLGHTGMITET
jgi:hypothetical protein